MSLPSKTTKQRLGFFVFLISLVACASTPQPSSTHQPEAPGNSLDVAFAPLFIDSVSVKESGEKQFIQVTGHLPTPCHNVAPVEERLQDGILHLTFSSWTNSEIMCSQVLEPFIFFYQTGENTPQMIFVNELPLTIN